MIRQIRISRNVVLKSFFSAVALSTVIGFVGYGLASGQETADAYAYSRDAQQGDNISPVPSAKKGKQQGLINRGSYLVNVLASCNDCHTCPSYRGLDPYKSGGASFVGGRTPINSANFLSGGTPFGSIISPDLTPDSAGRPGGLTYAKFKNALQNGTAHDGHILQVMPWPLYHNMYEQDFRAIYAYLQSIPPAPSGRGMCTAPAQAK
jgi:cytochrome c1